MTMGKLGSTVRVGGSGGWWFWHYKSHLVDDGKSDDDCTPEELVKVVNL